MATRSMTSYRSLLSTRDRGDVATQQAPSLILRLNTRFNEEIREVHQDIQRTATALER
jgi:hypothetical protein